ncbi:MAG: hypothetical protein A2940_02255 [Candidatus Wildermuthbacteria bacterium RIFCSPLOWO2_01_FULL_48_29]|uniref:Uncharacterized protein n=1 Tax=Candidatus Wildermuthbacteria bacterium RIFCSPLOWO2_01_FULL_48_29 TaxID=1802462 RepID=A0A1G2RQ94_9BACT|nr:MAG: hypothetical protein A2940_02255 [Candidatus Wildermuthbacteria bacterium RIFCSPLOWO2_01_FULL_48_29]
MDAPKSGFDGARLLLNGLLGLTLFLGLSFAFSPLNRSLGFFFLFLGEAWMWLIGIAYGSATGKHLMDYRYLLIALLGSAGLALVALVTALYTMFP